MTSAPASRAAWKMSRSAARCSARSRTLVHSTPKVASTHVVSAGGSWLSSQIVTSRRDDRMGQTPAGEPEAGRHVLELQIGQFLDDRFRRQARRQQVEDIRHPDAEAPNARTSAALGRINGDAIGEGGHAVSNQNIIGGLWRSLSPTPANA